MTLMLEHGGELVMSKLQRSMFAWIGLAPLLGLLTVAVIVIVSALFPRTLMPRRFVHIQHPSNFPVYLSELSAFGMGGVTAFMMDSHTPYPPVDVVPLEASEVVQRSRQARVVLEDPHVYEEQRDPVLLEVMYGWPWPAASIEIDRNIQVRGGIAVFDAPLLYGEYNYGTKSVDLIQVPGAGGRLPTVVHWPGVIKSTALWTGIWLLGFLVVAGVRWSSR